MFLKAEVRFRVFEHKKLLFITRKLSPSTLHNCKVKIEDHD